MNEASDSAKDNAMSWAKLRSSSFVSLFIIYLCLGCATTPTGRKQLKLIGSDQMSEMGKESFQQIKAKSKLSRNQKMIDLVLCVSGDLLQFNNFKKDEWEVRTFADQTPNAFALPGKKIGVHEGIFKAVKNQHQLAAVIGHEIAHVTSEHGNERVSQNLLVEGGLEATQLIIGQSSEEKSQTSGAIMAALGIGANIGILLPYSRKHELEADYVGLRYMASAGFDLNEAIKLWKNMDQLGSSGTPEFLSTHPNPKERIKKIRDSIPEVIPAEEYKRDGSPHCEDHFLGNKSA